MFGNTLRTDLLKFLLNGTAIPNIGDNAASAPFTIYYISLHTADPGGAGTQSTNEIAFTGYARQAVARTSGGWTVVGNSASPAAAITFPVMTAGAGGTVTHIGIGTLASGAGQLLLRGTPNVSLSVVNGIEYKLGTGSTITLT